MSLKIIFTILLYVSLNYIYIECVEIKTIITIIIKIKNYV